MCRLVVACGFTAELLDSREQKKRGTDPDPAQEQDRADHTAYGLTVASAPLPHSWLGTQLAWESGI